MKLQIFTVLLLFLLIFGCRSKRSDVPTVSDVRLPSFGLACARSESVISSRDLADVVVISFISDFCGPCIKEIETIESLVEDYNRRGLEFMMVLVGEGDMYLNVIDSLAFETHVVRADSAVMIDLQISSIPTRFLFANSNMVYRLQGSPSYKEQEFRQNLDSVLGIVREDADEVDEDIASPS